MMKEVGVAAVKAFHVEGDKRLDELRAMGKSMKEVGIDIFEPTGEITVKNLEPLLRACLEDGPQLVIPHVHSSIVDPITRRSDPAKIEDLARIGKRCLEIK